MTRTDRSLQEFVGAWEDVPPGKLAPFEDWIAHSDRSSQTEMPQRGRRRRK